MKTQHSLLINKYNIANLKKWAMLFIILRQLSKYIV